MDSATTPFFVYLFGYAALVVLQATARLVKGRLQAQAVPAAITRVVRG
jgi:hypothetical protein